MKEDPNEGEDFPCKKCRLTKDSGIENKHSFDDCQPSEIRRHLKKKKTN